MTMTRLSLTVAWFATVLIGLTACGGGGGGDAGPPADTQRPTTPGAVTAVADSPVTISVSWTAATDNTGVVGYDVSRDGAPLRSVTTTTTVDAGLAPGVQHCYSVSARDAAGNVSVASPAVCATPVNRPPVAALSAPESELTNATVAFDASTSQDPDGTIVEYAFDFGDGSATRRLAIPTVGHAYSVPGTYVVRVTTTDDLDASDSATVTVAIGIKLGAPVNISNTQSMSQGANAYRESDGSIDVVWEEFGADLLFARSTDGGLTFTPPQHVIDPDGVWGSTNDYAASQMKIVEAGGTIHVVTTLFDLVFGGAEVFHVGSSDQGVTFGDPVFVSANDGINSYAPAVDAEGNGTVSMVWQEADLILGTNAISYSHSVDDGATFAIPSTVSAPPEFAGCAQVLWSANDVLTLWTEGAFGTERILAARTVDAGATFGVPVDVDRNPAKSWCATVVRDAGGTAYAVWQEGDAFVDTRIRFARSADRGVSFTTPVTLSAVDRSAICPSIEVGDGRMVVTWTYQEGAALADSYLVASTDGGATFSAPLRIPSGATGRGCYEIVARDAASVGLIWNDPPAAGVMSEVYFARAQLSIP